jgi:hypothetical protein
MSQSKSKHNHNKNQPMIPNSNPTGPQAEDVSGSGTTNQNLNQNYITQQGNPIRNNTPGNTDDQRHSPFGKPRSNPQGNNPMSVDKSQKGPGSRAD